MCSTYNLGLCRHTWIDDLYYYAKQRQLHEKVERSTALGKAELQEMGAILEGSSTEGSSSSPSAEAQDSSSEAQDSAQDSPEKNLEASSSSSPSPDSEDTVKASVQVAVASKEASDGGSSPEKAAVDAKAVSNDAVVDDGDGDESSVGAMSALEKALQAGDAEVRCSLVFHLRTIRILWVKHDPCSVFFRWPLRSPVEI